MQENSNARVARARERFALGDYHGTAFLLDELIESGHAYADAHQLRGVALALLGQPEQALEAFETALTLNPRYVEALVHRGLVLGDLGRSDEAADLFRRAAAEDAAGGPGLPPQARGRIANLHADLAEAYADASAFESAIEQYRYALELGPAYHDLRLRLARVLLRAGRYLEAREELERVVEARPALAEAMTALGLARYLSGDAAGALDVWHACRAQLPSDPRLGAYLAMVERVPQ